jgi:hypothetical protein
MRVFSLPDGIWPSFLGPTSPLPLFIGFTGLGRFTFSHLLAMAHFLLLLLFLLSLFPLNHAEPPLPRITGFSLDVPLVEVGLLGI